MRVRVPDLRDYASLPGREIGYAEITSYGTNLVVGAADITGLTMTFTTGPQVTAIELELYCYALIQNVGSGLPYMQITDAANAVKLQVTGGTTAATQYSGTFYGKRRLTVSPSTSYTFKARGGTTGAGNTATLQPDPNFPIFIRAENV